MGLASAAQWLLQAACVAAAQSRLTTTACTRGPLACTSVLQAQQRSGDQGPLWSPSNIFHTPYHLGLHNTHLLVT